MTTPAGPPSPRTRDTGGCPLVHDSPGNTVDERVRLHDPQFAQDPHAKYTEMRKRYGALAPVELADGAPATLVLGYRTAVRILHDEAHFPSDPRSWQKTVPQDSPVLAMMGWHPAARYATGREHERYRQASRASIDSVDLHALHGVIEDVAVALISGFFDAESVDVISQYAHPLVVQILNHLLGCPPELGATIAAGMAARFDAGTDAATGMKVLQTALKKLIGLKRAAPGEDMTTRLIEYDPDLDDEQVAAQLMSFYGAGVEALHNLIGNTVLLMVTDSRFGGGLVSGSLSTRDALDEVLFKDPPMANWSTTYPRQPVFINDVWLPADQPVVISLAACNNDPVIGGADVDRTGNRSHLAWSAGRHVCPASSLAYLIAEDAVSQLLDALTDLALAVEQDELEWRPGPFHRALTALPVTFARTARPTTGLYAYADRAAVTPHQPPSVRAHPPSDCRLTPTNSRRRNVRSDESRSC